MRTELKENVFIDWQRAHLLSWFVGILVLLMVLTFALYWGVALSLFVGVVLAYLLSPLVHYLEDFGLKRYYAVPFISLILLTIITMAFWFIVPTLYKQISQLFALAPQALENFVRYNLPIIEEKISEVPFLSQFDLVDFLRQQLPPEEVGQRFLKALAGVWSEAPKILSWFMYVMLAPVLTFFILLNEPKMLSTAWRLVPRDLVLPMKIFINNMNRNFLLLIRGMLTVATILGVLYMVGFSLVGLKFALLIGLIAGICRIIPYLDILVATVLSAVALFADFQGWGQVLMVLGVFAFVFTVDGLLVTPKIIGESIGLHPVFLIISILAFGYWWGIAGVLLAIPVTTLGKVIFRSILPFYMKSPWYRPDFEEYRP